MKKIRMIFALAFVGVFSLLGAACSGGGQEPSSSESLASSSSVQEEEKFQEPALNDVSVDVSDRPEGMLIGDAELTGVSLDGDDTFNKYVVREGYFLLTHEYYGDIGLGEHTVAFTFSNYRAISVKITVGNSVAPDYTMPEGKFLEYTEKTAMELPEAVRNRKYQTYDIHYALKDGKNQTLFEVGGQADEKLAVADGLAAGTYTYTVTVSKEDTTIETKDYVVVVGVGENIFAAKHQEAWTVQAVSNIKKSFDEEENALTVTPLTEDDRAAAFTSHNRRIYINTLLKDAYEAGYEILNFEYKSTFAGNENYGFRVYANSKDNAVNANMVTEVLTVSNTAGNLVTGEWTQVKINIKSLFERAEIDGISIVVLGNVEGSMSFRHSYFGMTSDDVFSEEYAWTSSDTNGVVTAYSTAEQARKVTYKQVNNDGMRGRRFVAFASIEKIKKAYDAGKKALNFQAKATAAMSIHVYAKKNNGLDGAAITDNATQGIASYGTFDLTTEYAEYSIDLEKFFTAKASTLAYADINYIGIVFYGATPGDAYFKNATYRDEYIAPAEPEKPAVDYAKVDVFSSANASGWVAQAGVNTKVSFDTTESAVKVQNVTYSDASNQFTSNNRRIYMNSIFSEAYKAGYTKFVFSYKSALTGGANYGFRIYANDSTLATNANMKTQIKQVSGADLVSGAWTQVEIDLSSFAGENVFGLSIVVIGEANSSILFKGGAFAK